MKKRIVSLLLCALLLVGCCSALAEDFGSYTFRISGTQQFKLFIPKGWTDYQPKDDSEYSDWVEKPFVVFQNDDLSKRVLVFDIYSTTSAMDLNDAAAFLTGIGVPFQWIEADGVQMLEGYSAELGLFGRAFLNLNGDGYYIVAVMPGNAGALADQDPLFISIFEQLQVFKPEGQDTAKAVTEAPAETEAPNENVEDAVETVESPADGADALQTDIAALQAQVAALTEQVMAYQSKLAEAEAALMDAQAALAAAQEAAQAAQNKCPNCGYAFPEGSEYRFCPECGTPR